MAKKHDKNIIVGLDIGTSKIAAIVGEIRDDQGIDVIGLGRCDSHGLKKGVVVDIESTVQAIQSAVAEAELMSGIEISSVYAGIAGSHVASQNSEGIVAIRDREVSQADVDRVIDAARAVPTLADREILHILPQEFIIDNQEGIQDPIGMSGIRMEVKVHLVTGAVSAVQNITKCIRRCGLEVEDLILEQLASCYAVLQEDEKELGVCLADIGGGTTDIALYKNGGIRYTDVIPIAGHQVTHDIAVGLRTPTLAAEDIKKKYACALASLVHTEQQIEVPSIGDRPARSLSRQTLAEVVEPRYDELLGLIQTKLQHSGFAEQAAGGVVLTGGSAKMEGLLDLAEEVFHMPVRLGVPTNIHGLPNVQDPSHATGVGLLLYAQQDNRARRPGPLLPDTSLQTIWQRMKQWFQGNF